MDSLAHHPAGLNGKAMSYDGENRPLTVVAANGDVTRYVYAADGSRLKRIVTANGVTTTSLYLSEVEIVNPGAGEEVRWYPHPNVRITRSGGNLVVTYPHRDQLDSVVLIADDVGGEDLERIYEPFGQDQVYGIPDGEDKGFVGERKDGVAGLQYLNARYYDPELAMFIQPDWFEVTLAGVGTNRYAYSFNDPVNLRDPEGNLILGAIIGGIISLGVDMLTGKITGDMPSASELAKSFGTGAVAGMTGSGIVGLPGKAKGPAKAASQMGSKTKSIAYGMAAGGIAGATGSAIDQSTTGDGIIGPDQLARDTFTSQITGGIVRDTGLATAVSGGLAPDPEVRASYRRGFGFPFWRRSRSGYRQRH